MVEQPLTTAHQQYQSDLGKWVAETAAAIEKLGDLNPSNRGFVVTREEPGPDGLSAIIIPHSVDWQAHDMLQNLPALQRLKAEDPKKYAQLKNLGERTIHRALSDALWNEVKAWEERLTQTPTYKLAELSDGEVEIVDNLLTVAEEQTPRYMSFMQLFVEDRLDFVLGRNNAQLIEFKGIPITKQLSARRKIVEVFGWQKYYDLLK